VRIVAPHASETTPYIQSVSLHGRPYNRPWLHFSTLTHGATLRFDLSATPNTAWGSSPAVAPPSWDDGTAAARRLAPANGIRSSSRRIGACSATTVSCYDR